MSESPSHEPEQAPEGHEETDVKGYGFLIFTILFVSGLGSMTLFLIWLLRALASATPAEPASALASRVFPQGVPLQASIVHPESPREDLARLRQYHRHLLESYGWVDRKNQTVRVPIERAMRLYIERGAPAGGVAPATRAGSAPSTPQSGGAP